MWFTYISKNIYFFLKIDDFTKIDTKISIPLTHFFLFSFSPRDKNKCPVSWCSKEFVNQPLHMRKVHQWTDASAQNVGAMFGLRRKPEAAKKKYTHYNKICPFEGCYSVTKNPGEH